VNRAQRCERRKRIPTLGDLAEMAGVSSAEVQSAIDKGVELGCIELVSDDGKCREYRLTMPPGAES
jgi:hypothetical protein